MSDVEIYNMESIDGSGFMLDIPRVSPGCYITIQQALADTEAAYAMIRARLVIDDVDIKESSDVAWVGPKEFRAQFYFPEGLRQGRYGVRYVFLSMDDTWKPVHWTSYNWPPERVRKLLLPILPSASVN
jgi:hypothetical protein